MKHSPLVLIVALALNMTSLSRVGLADETSGPATPAPATGGIQIGTNPSGSQNDDISDRSNCGANDQDCRIRLGEVLNNSILLAPILIEGGVRFGDNNLNGAVRFRVPLVELNFQQGDLSAFAFDAVYLPEAGGFRLRFTTLESEALFFCKDDAGNWHAPLATLFIDSCTPTGFVGAGGAIMQVQWDQVRDRFAARWADIHLVLNLLRNSNGREYLNRHVNFMVGGSAEFFRNGGERRNMARAKFAISGMVLSRNNHWELNAYAGYRPNVAAWDNFGIETRAQVLYHLMMGQQIAGTIGITAEYNYWSRPEFSMGNFTSDEEKQSAYVGLLFGARFDGVLQRRH